jgi:CBS domain containing-hemolysin-like protein
MSVAHIFILVAQLVLMVLSAFCSGSETALFALTYNDRLQLRKRSARAAGAVERLLAEPRSLLITLLLANMTANVVFLALGSVLLLSSENKALGATLNAVTVIVLVAAGEVLPKLLAASQRVRLALVAAPLVLALYQVMGPLRRVTEGVVIAPLTRLLRPAATTEAGRALLSVDELSALVELGASQGDIERDEQQLLAQVVELGTVRIRDVMSPRVQIYWLSSTARAEEVVDLVRRTGVTHIPVYKGSPDKEILGMLDARRYLGSHAAGRTPRLTEGLEKVIYVPETARLDKLLAHFGRSHSEVVLCVDEYGTVDGLVRIGDVADRLVAKFAEEDAVVAEMEELAEQGVKRLGEGKWSVPGKLGVREWSELFGQAIDRRVSTVGGLMMSRLGRVPRVGDEVDFGNLHMRVSAMRGNLIERLEVFLVEEAEAAPGERG